MAFAKSAVLFEILCSSLYSKLKYSFLSHLIIHDIPNQNVQIPRSTLVKWVRYATIIIHIS